MTIDLSDVGKTNETYSDADSEIILRALFIAENRLRELQSNSTETTSDTDDQIQALINEIHRYNVALAPHKKLSEDILRNIFIACAGSAPMTFPAARETGGKDGLRTPPPVQLILSQVCATWRQIALCSAKLWNNVIVRCMSENTGVINDAREWLARAKDSVIDLELQGQTSDTGISISCAIHVIECLILGHRIRKLHMGLNYESNKHLVELWKLVDLPDTLAALEYLEDMSIVCETFPYCDRKPLGPVSLQVNLPRIKRLHLRIASWISAYELSIPWHQLSHLEFSLYPISASWFMSVLQQCISLQDCRATITLMENEKFIPPTEDICLPELTVLHLHILSFPQLVNDFLRPFIIPNLREVMFWFGELPSGWQINDPYINSRINFSQLRSMQLFSISGMSPTYSTSSFHVGELLRLTPLLRHLELPIEAVFDGGTMDRIAAGQLGPRLQRLIVRGLIARYTPQFLKMIEDRQEAARNGDGTVLPFEYVEFPTLNIEKYCFRSMAMESTHGVQVVLHSAPPNLKELYPNITIDHYREPV